MLSRKYGNLPINNVLNQYKPTGLPSFMDRDRCLFFYPARNPIMLYPDHDVEVIVPAERLNSNRLFAFSLDDAQKIYQEVAVVPYYGEHIDEPLETVAIRYWNERIPFTEYSKRQHSLVYNVELLYFDDISPNQLIIL
jgi:hypothetical protein